MGTRLRGVFYGMDTNVCQMSAGQEPQMLVAVVIVAWIFFSKSAGVELISWAVKVQKLNVSEILCT